MRPLRNGAIMVLFPPAFQALYLKLPLPDHQSFLPCELPPLLTKEPTVVFFYPLPSLFQPPCTSNSHDPRDPRPKSQIFSLVEFLTTFLFSRCPPCPMHLVTFGSAHRTHEQRGTRRVPVFGTNISRKVSFFPYNFNYGIPFPCI